MNRYVPVAVMVLAGCGDRGAEIVSQGTVEVPETDIAANTSGRINRIRVEEGALVHRGDTLITLTATTLPSDLAAYEARVARARAELAELERGSRVEDIRTAEAQVRGSTAESERIERDLQRLMRLGESGAVAEQEVDHARAAATLAASRRDAALSGLERLQRGARREEIEATRARVTEALAALEAVRATSGELTLIAPSDGIVMPFYSEVGELVPAGRVAITLADPARPWVRVYVGERDLTWVSLGQRVRARVDGRPDLSFHGRVVAISHEAEFTPRVALTEDERDDLVFAVKVALSDSGRLVRAGLPMTVYFPRTAPVVGDSTTLQEGPR